MKTVFELKSAHFRAVSRHLGPCFAHLRRQAHLSQSAVAHAAGVSRCTVSDFETGKRLHVSIDFVEALAHAVGATLMTLISLADQAAQAEAECLI